MQKCRECGGDLIVSEEQKKTFNFRDGEQTIIRKLYQCTNPECENYQHYAVPDCKHDFGNRDYGQYMFEHCYFCVKCGYFVCYDSSG